MNSCEWLSFQNTANIQIIGLWELVEIDSIGKTVAGDSSDQEMPPFIYREWYGWTQEVPQQPIDSLYYLKTKQGEMIDKWNVDKEIDHNKRKQRYEYLLSNGKYIFTESKDDFFTVSIQIDDPSLLNKDIKKGLYKYVADKPDNWW